MRPSTPKAHTTARSSASPPVRDVPLPPIAPNAVKLASMPAVTTPAVTGTGCAPGGNVALAWTGAATTEASTTGRHSADRVLLMIPPGQIAGRLRTAAGAVPPLRHLAPRTFPPS